MFLTWYLIVPIEANLSLEQYDVIISFIIVEMSLEIVVFLIIQTSFNSLKDDNSMFAVVRAFIGVTSINIM